jgi:hypothetical protein
VVPGVLSCPIYDVTPGHAINRGVDYVGYPT